MEGASCAEEEREEREEGGEADGEAAGGRTGLSMIIWWVVVHGYKFVEWLIPKTNDNKHYFFRLRLPLL